MGRFANLRNSWRSVWTLIKLQFKAGVKLTKGKSRSATAAKYGLLAACGIGALAIFVLIYTLLADKFIGPRGHPGDLRHEFLTFSLAIFHLIQTLFMLPMLIKTLDINNDREMLLRWPVSPRQIFLSKIIVAYLHEIIFSAVLLVPIIVAYGITAGMNYGYYLLIPVMLLLAPILPFFISSLLMYPVQRIVNFLRGHQNITILIYFAGLIGGIFLYMEIINGALYAVLNGGFERTLLTDAGSIRDMAAKFAPWWLFARMLDSGAGWLVISLASMVGISAVLGGIGFFVASANYKRTYMDERTAISTLRKKSPFKKHSSFFASTRKDILNIFRSSNYTFQFLLLVVLTPLLVYFCNRVAMFSAYQTFMSYGNAGNAIEIVFGASMFVIMILIPLASSFAASSVTREGHNIYHTKLIPVSFRRQLFIKSMIMFVPILLSILVAAAMVMIPYKFNVLAPEMAVPVADAMYLFGLGLALAVGYICLGMYLDLRKPLCNQVGGAELVKSTAHINLIMGVGLCVGGILGVLCMFGGFADLLQFGGIIDALFGIGQNAKMIYLPVAIAFAVISAGLLFLNGPRKYYRLEQ